MNSTFVSWSSSSPAARRRRRRTISHDNRTGVLDYDADGARKGAAIKFAQLAGKPKMAAADFDVS